MRPSHRNAARPLVAPAPPALAEVAWAQARPRPQDYPRWLAFSDDTGLIAKGSSPEAATRAYEQALPERRPVDFPWADEPVSTDPIIFDGSVFHPLDHWPLSARCRSFFGGARNHLGLWWDYQAGLVRPANLLARAACRFGRHQPVDWWMSSPASGASLNAGASCRSCAKPLPRIWSEPRPA